MLLDDMLSIPSCSFHVSFLWCFPWYYAFEALLLEPWLSQCPNSWQTSLFTAQSCRRKKSARDFRGKIHGVEKKKMEVLYYPAHLITKAKSQMSSRKEEGLKQERYKKTKSWCAIGNTDEGGSVWAGRKGWGWGEKDMSETGEVQRGGGGQWVAVSCWLTFGTGWGSGEEARRAASIGGSLWHMDAHTMEHIIKARLNVLTWASFEFLQHCHSSDFSSSSINQCSASLKCVDFSTSLLIYFPEWYGWTGLLSGLLSPCNRSSIRWNPKAVKLLAGSPGADICMCTYRSAVRSNRGNSECVKSRQPACLKAQSQACTQGFCVC